MKHLLALLPIALAFAATAASAAFTYEVVWGGYELDHILQTDDQQELSYTVRINRESIDLYYFADRIDDDGNSPKDSGRGIVRYGYYRVIVDEEAEEDDEKLDLSKAEPFEIEKTLQNDQFVTRYGYYLGTIHSEEEVKEEDPDEKPDITASDRRSDGAHDEEAEGNNPLELLKWGHYDPEAANLSWNAEKIL